MSNDTGVEGVSVGVSANFYPLLKFWKQPLEKHG